MTRGDAKTLLRAEFSLKSTGEEDTLLDTWIQRGVHDVMLKARFGIELLTLTYSQSEFTSFPGTLWVDHSSIQQSDVAGNPIGDVVLVSFAEIQRRRRELGADASLEKLYLAIEGDSFAVWPSPTGTQRLSYYGISKPTAMTSDANDFSTTVYGPVPDEFADAVIKYVAFEVARYDDKKMPLSPRDYAQIYADRIREIRKERRRGQPPLAAKVGYPDRGSVPIRNDVYPRY